MPVCGRRDLGIRAAPILVHTCDQAMITVFETYVSGVNLFCRGQRSVQQLGTCLRVEIARICPGEPREQTERFSNGTNKIFGALNANLTCTRHRLIERGNHRRGVSLVVVNENEDEDWNAETDK